jgi:hypothetical protein
MPQIHDWEEVLLATNYACQKKVTRALANNFWELKSNIATFMALVWVLFGLECNYYKGLQNI